MYSIPATSILNTREQTVLNMLFGECLYKSLKKSTPESCNILVNATIYAITGKNCRIVKVTANTETIT